MASLVFEIQKQGCELALWRNDFSRLLNQGQNELLFEK